MKRMILLATGLSLISLQAHAISRYNSLSMSCERAQAVVRQEGAAILRYHSTRNPSLPLYDRYVANGSYCQIDEYARLDYVPTSDAANCPVLKCQQFSYEPFGDN
jgi:hypothetical protein